MDFSDLVVLIPALRPQDGLPAYVDSLISRGFGRVVVVDDGSGPAFADVFARLAAAERCVVLGYSVNRGKGFALKHGLSHAMAHFRDASGIVTADSDGQHTVEDVVRMGTELRKHSTKLLIGTRNFSAQSVPLKSILGNRLTSVFFALLYGRWLPDTQTGLRAFSMELAGLMAKIPGSRYEYEMNALIHCVGRHVDFHVVPIETVYIADNKGSHFRPLQDSARIYWQLFRNFFGFASSSTLSTLVDIGLFTALDKWLLPLVIDDPLRTVLWGVSVQVLAATAVARLISAVFNYRVNRSLVFQSARVKGSLRRYLFLCGAVMLLSASLVSLLSLELGADRTLTKVLVDTALFFVNYRVQRAWVFAEKTPSEA